MFIVAVVFMVVLECFVIGEGVGLDVQVTDSGVIGQVHGQRWGNTARVTAPVDELSHGPERGGVLFECIADGLIERGRTMRIREICLLRLSLLRRTIRALD